MKEKVNKQRIIETSVSIIDEYGLNSLTIKSIAEALGVKSPAIYKHFTKGVLEIKQELTFYAWKILDEKILRNIVGKSMDDAIIEMCKSYREFGYEHPGLFSATHWYNSFSSVTEYNASIGIVQTLYKILDGYKLSDTDKLHILRILRAFIQGYVDIEIHNGFGDKTSTEESFIFALKLLLNGINLLKEEYVNVEE